MKGRTDAFKYLLIALVASLMLVVGGCTRDDREGTETPPGDQNGTIRQDDGTTDDNTMHRGDDTMDGTGTMERGGTTDDRTRGGEMGTMAGNLTERIKNALEDDNSITTDVDELTITTESRGTVTLRGNVKNEQEKRAIETRVKGITGVNKVENLLQVEQD